MSTSTLFGSVGFPVSRHGGRRPIASWQWHRGRSAAMSLRPMTSLPAIHVTVMSATVIDPVAGSVAAELGKTDIPAYKPPYVSVLERCP